MEDQKPRGLVWHLTTSFLKEEGLNQKLKMKIYKLGDVCKLTSLTQTYRRRGSGGEASSRWVIFCNFLEKTYCNAIGSHFVCVQNHLKEPNF